MDRYIMIMFIITYIWEIYKIIKEEVVIKNVNELKNLSKFNSLEIAKKKKTPPTSYTLKKLVYQTVCEVFSLCMFR